MQNLKRIVRRDKNAFLSDQYKEIEEHNRMGKTRALFKTISYQENISCKHGHNKRQKWYGLTEAEDVKRWQKNCTKQVLFTQRTTMV